MGSIESLLAEEFTRVLRREVGPKLDEIRKLVAAHAKDVAAVKGRIDRIERGTGISKARKHADRKKIPGDGVGTDATDLRTIRRSLEISAQDLASLMDVSIQSIYNWESGKTRPRSAQHTKLSKLLQLPQGKLRRRLANA
ncbi:helix-turn-helix domain-containing protein [Tahibacter amnicola]|uniref:Helix-turn-helix transcriptional regulator n=1 Tax=Tahibacter amnicola TaxID=2976241 RepID=A0ABY6BIM5_9GAMM|nr:helix-turn-helix transcriptional regulator [Tahibacter amnicola]UXI68945.1 helix-turn-helix transcriptional regulator [Tahibacter amnicola]